MDMKKGNILHLMVGVVVLILAAGAWYVYEYRECVNKVSYVPAKEEIDAGDGYYGSVHSVDKGDYYVFFSTKFRTSDDAVRACIWK